MINDQMNFNPTTGQPINKNINNSSVSNQEQQVNVQYVQAQTTPQVQTVPTQIPTVTTVQSVPTVEPVQTIPTQIPTANNIVNPQHQMQNIPTIEQSKQEFINNVQTNNTINKEEKKDGPNITFIVILFVIIFAAIFFLFPYLLKVLG